MLSVISTLLVMSRAEADAILAENVPSELLQAEHRAAGGRSAEPDSFLDRIADLFGGSNKKKPQQKVSRPQGPVYRPNIPTTKRLSPHNFCPHTNSTSGLGLHRHDHECSDRANITFFLQRN